MLYKLEVENFASIRDLQVLDLRIGANVPVDPERFAEIFPGAGTYVPKVVAIYGANASGKTNLLLALQYILKMAATIEEPRPSLFPFNTADGLHKATRIAVEFAGGMNPSQPELPDYGLYRYELSVLALPESGPAIIQHESLRRKPAAQGKWQRVFERDESGLVTGSDVFPIRGYAHLVKTLRKDATVLASFAYFRHPAAIPLSDAARRSIVLTEVLGSTDEHSVHKHFLGYPDSLNALNDRLSRIDLGVESMRYDLTEDGPKPLFKHFGLSQEMHWRLESHGTRSFIRLFPLLDAALNMGLVCAIDELDAALHPLLLPEILNWFFNNPRNSQLWFTCHSPTLLEELKKEEVVICEKDRQGCTSFYSLMDVKARRDDNLYRKYMSGAYGGVPLLG